MLYALLFSETDTELAKRHDPAAAPAYWGGWMEYIRILTDAGVNTGGHGLEPPAVATTLRLRDGARHVQDGPFAATKEMLGGFVVLDVPDLDTALDWAARAPCAETGCVEIRPVLVPQTTA